MRVALPKLVAGAIAVVWLCGAGAAVAISAPAQTTWRVSGGDVRVTCPMTVGGSFEARTAALTGVVGLVSPGTPSLSGRLVVDLATLDTGIELRNDHMRETYLEIGRGQSFDHAVVSDIDLGGVDPADMDARVHFTGRLLLHGVTRPVRGEATIHRGSSGWQVRADFHVRLPDFGIAKPRYLGVGVRDDVRVAVAFEAVPTGSGEEEPQ